jgi:hypothetical protein
MFTLAVYGNRRPEACNASMCSRRQMRVVLSRGTRPGTKLPTLPLTIKQDSWSVLGPGSPFILSDGGEREARTLARFVQILLPATQDVILPTRPNTRSQMPGPMALFLKALRGPLAADARARSRSEAR